MKRILITGKNSYIGTSFKKFMSANDEILVDEVDTKNNNWSQNTYEKYDAVFHVAGIAHVSSDPDMESLYYEVNRDLTIKIAEKAKKDGVKQFIFMSSIIVYGNKNHKIDSNTVPNPENFYGRSKLEAEYGLHSLEDNTFKVVILRPPMIYGENSKGNYPRLSKVARKTPVFPNYKNERSMLYINNLCAFIRLMIINEESGTFFPQNEEYVCTSELVSYIAKCHDHKLWLPRFFNLIVRYLIKIDLIKKIFGNLTYDKNMSQYHDRYQINDFEESIKLTEGV